MIEGFHSISGPTVRYSVTHFGVSPGSVSKLLLNVWRSIYVPIVPMLLLIKYLYSTLSFVLCFQIFHYNLCDKCVKIDKTEARIVGRQLLGKVGEMGRGREK